MTHSAPMAISVTHSSAWLSTVPLPHKTALFKYMLKFFSNKMSIIYSKNIICGMSKERLWNVSNQGGMLQNRNGNI